MLSRIEMRGIAIIDEPRADVISTKLYVSFLKTVLNGGSSNGGKPSAMSPKKLISIIKQSKYNHSNKVYSK